MFQSPRFSWTRRAMVVLGWVLAGTLAAFGGPVDPVAGMNDAQVHAYGEQIYRKGILPSGEPIRVTMPGGGVVTGSAFSCASCHTRSGLGTMAEGVRPLPINGPKLFQALYPYFPTLSEEERAVMVPARFQTPPVRPAYTDATLVRAIRDGIDPAGRTFNPSMPRFLLTDGDAGILIRYLQELSCRPDPGVSATSLALATVVTDEVPAADREAMLGTLERSIQANNNLGPKAQGNMGSMLGMREMSLGYRKRTLARWLLKGEPETWPAQLEAYYRQEPVFALVGGISTRPWEPIHRFCETHRIPCLFPLTELPVISGTDFYTVYFSKGLYLEGEAAARVLGARLDPGHPATILQVLAPGPEARALADGFQAAWAELGKARVDTLALADASSLPADFLTQSIGPAAVLLWTGPEAFPALARALDTPPLVFMSGTLLGRTIWDLPLPARASTWLTYPYRKPGPAKVIPKMGGRPYVVDKAYQLNDRRIASRTATVVDLVNEVISRMERNYYRDHLLDLVGMMEDKVNTDYETLSFGAELRYVSEGCLLMRLSGDSKPVLLPISGK